MYAALLWRESGGALATRGLVGGKNTYRSIICSPDAVSITCETSPGCNANEASSNSFCMSPFPKNPLHRTSGQRLCFPARWKPACSFSETAFSSHVRQLHARDFDLIVVVVQHEEEWAVRSVKTYRSPRFLAELQSLSVTASSPRLVLPLLIFCSWFWMTSRASSLERVICASLHDDGRRESRCLTSRWAHRIFPSRLWFCRPSCRRLAVWYWPM